MVKTRANLLGEAVGQGNCRLWLAVRRQGRRERRHVKPERLRPASDGALGDSVIAVTLRLACPAVQAINEHEHLWRQLLRRLVAVSKLLAELGHDRFVQRFDRCQRR
jgi:hypothetical protein